MPRRSPPTSLRLAEGPTPARTFAKFAVPSLPRPTFHPPSVMARGPRSRPQTAAQESDWKLLVPFGAQQVGSTVVDLESILALPKPVAYVNR
ncbi:hypothetical protein BD626DRAFT_508210 [Schizophyllum amplum]|uniref:Uncharacterized protein n=1 Tax=Schizophyllum amplum TaxID=97359 RepID=A0A550C3Q1_9AGAR|nr:hypothetical protein BD626DRAFT_508210 [Auriculariopsis ampla]